MISTPSIYAGCDREDVDYYLSKGFTPAQIAAICSGTTAQVSTETSDTILAPDATDKQSEEKLLQSLISGVEISLTDDEMTYTQEVCVSYEYDAYYPPDQVVCPQVQVTISRKGLKVLKTESPIFDGDHVVVSGTIHSKLLDNFEEKSAEERKLIHAEFKNKNQANIKLKHKASAAELAEALVNISR